MKDRRGKAGEANWNLLLSGLKQKENLPTRERQMGETTRIARHWKKKVSIAQDFIEPVHHIVLLYMRYLSVFIIRSFLRSKAMETVESAHQLSWS